MNKFNQDKFFKEDEVDMFLGILAKSAKPAREFLRAEDTEEVKRLLGEALSWVQCLFFSFFQNLTFCK